MPVRCTLSSLTTWQRRLVLRALWAAGNVRENHLRNRHPASGMGCGRNMHSGYQRPGIKEMQTGQVRRLDWGLKLLLPVLDSSRASCQWKVHNYRRGC
eukprot:XP_001709623.1 Hypothetical protein GL50803_99726 [Giardia lamblia ATCC 50803]